MSRTAANGANRRAGADHKSGIGGPGPRRALSRRHNHQLCIEDALDRAEAVCAARGTRLTAIRRRVLEFVWGQHQPIGAYVILERLRKENAAAAPPTVYRALEFLMAQGLVHRLASLNAFIGCPQPEAIHTSQFLICTSCGEVTEIEGGEITASAQRKAAERGFSLDRLTIELAGRCPRCDRAHGVAAHAQR
jgi:Fur family transcriptional regulator, zinc uptake regulator